MSTVVGPKYISTALLLRRKGKDRLLFVYNRRLRGFLNYNEKFAVETAVVTDSAACLQAAAESGSAQTVLLTKAVAASDVSPRPSRVLTLVLVLGTEVLV